jgi:hypothetical protein
MEIGGKTREPKVGVFQHNRLVAAILCFAASSRINPDCAITDGPMPTFVAKIGRCDAARHSGLSLRAQNRVVGEFTVCGIIETFAAAAPKAALDGVGVPANG